MSLIIYRSSAGSGKTFTLVKEYLKIVLQQPEKFRNILALTFTNKAANEMRDRILRSLTSLSGNPDDHDESIVSLREQIINETGMEADAIRRKADRSLKMILHHYSDFSVGTIDSFVHRVIRTFARDLHLPLNFEVELDSDVLTAKAVETLLDNVGKDKDLTRALVDFTIEKTLDHDNWNIESDLEGLTDHIFQERGQIALDKIKHLDPGDFSGIRDRIYIKIRQFEKELRDLCSGAMAIITRSGLREDAFHQGSRGVYSYLKTNTSLTLDPSKVKPSANAMATLQNGKWKGGKIRNDQIPVLESIVPELNIIAANILRLLDQKAPGYFLNISLYEFLWPLTLLSRISNIIDEIKKEGNILPIGEFNRRIARIVLSEPVPFIYERLGEKYHYFLIDEFQDTSFLQWQNMLPLVDNALSEGHHAVIVGDGKQAIYRWRNGEVEQFAKLPGIYGKKDDEISREREKALIRNHEIRNLSTNFRTRSEIVKFNNGFFDFISGKYLSADYKELIYNTENLIQEPLMRKTGGHVQVEFIEGDNEGGNFDEKNLLRITSILEEVTNAGYRQGEVAILCRGNEKASLAARYLIGKGIKVQSSESVLLFKSPLVNFLVSLLYCISDPADQISARTVRMCLEKPENHGRSQAVHDRTAYEYMTVYEIVEDLVRHYKLYDKASPFICFFLDAVLQWSATNHGGIRDFLQWWEEQKEKLILVAPPADDAVRIMTVHKAKGLEFPVVIYAFANQKMKLTYEKAWVDIDDPGIPEMKKTLVRMNKRLDATILKDQFREETAKSELDFLNLLYVAMTRPEDRLYILTGKPPKEPEGINTAGLLKEWFSTSGEGRVNGDVVTAGEPAYFIREHRPLTGDFTVDRMISTKWRDRISLRLRFRDVWEMAAQGRQRERGKMIHFLLAGLRSVDDISDVIRRGVDSGVVERNETLLFGEKLEEICNLPEIAAFFSGKGEVISEAELLLPGGQLYRPDRLVLLPGKTGIIEYKTGEKKESHWEQVRKYTEIIGAMGYPAPEGWLIYLGGMVETVRVC